MKPLRLLLILLCVLAVFAGGYGYGRWYGNSQAVQIAAGHDRRVLYYVDPMHLTRTSDKPGLATDGMKLEPVYANDAARGSSPGSPETPPPAMPAGTVQLASDKQQLIGVKYGNVESAAGSRTIRAVGKVAVDETRIEHVHTRVEGWIDKVFVDFTGKLVQKGDPLLTIYSPDLLASQRELLLAAKAKTLMQNSTFPPGFDESESLLQASRRRLELWDLSEAQIDQVLKTGQPIKNVTLYSPATGYVTDRKAFPQQKVTADTDLYTIVDLSHVWIMADLFEYEAPNIHMGETAHVSLQALPGKTFNARINYIQPEVDPMTRTLKVRLDMDNPGVLLKPDMYADIEFRVNVPAKLTVPTDAVLDAGERKTVFVDRGNGYLEPRQVKTGDRVGDRIQILSGLSAGERVVTSGNFLIDSESQLKAAAAGMAGMPGMGGGTKNGENKNPPKSQIGESGTKGMADMPGMGATKPEAKKP